MSLFQKIKNYKPLNEQEARDKVVMQTEWRICPKMKMNITENVIRKKLTSAFRKCKNH